MRWDSGIEAGDVVQPAFDSMIAKLIVHADSRDAALVRARRALRELEVEGPATVIPFDLLALDDEAFATETFAVHTQWIDPEMVGEVLQVIRDLASGGMTMVLVTHEMGFAREVSGRTVFMDAGVVVEEAPPAELFGAPKNERLKDFLSKVL